MAPTDGPLFVGLMSGTSLDGVDGVLTRLGDSIEVLAHRHQAFEPSVRDELLALNRRGGSDELQRSAIAAADVADAYAGVVRALLQGTGTPACDVRAIGAHGQTVRHQPGARQGFTIQLLDGARLAEHTGIDVVCDLRSRDVAAGGQGAPLAPAFHAACFARPGQATAVLNVGGIANLTLLGADGRLLGFDCGPGNALMDHWVQRHLGQAFDGEGAWAASAAPDEALLAALLADPFFALEPPKSTGRDLFNPDWLDPMLSARGPLAPATVQASLLALTVRSSAGALMRHAPTTSRLRVCGGGARNRALMQALVDALPAVDVRPSDADGVPADQVEALAFAWLARAFVDGVALDLSAVTGAAGPRRLGALYPGR